jgi:hypothetical protein
MLKMKLSRLKGKGHVQPSQDNCDHIVKKLEKGSTVTCAKLPKINLKTSYQKVDKPKIEKKHISSTLSDQHCDTSHPNVPTRKMIKQISIEDKETYLREDTLPVNKKSHNIADCRKEEASKQVCQNWIIGLTNRSIRF